MNTVTWIILGLLVSFAFGLDRWLTYDERKAGGLA